MLAHLVLLTAAAIAPVCRAASATIFPVALGPEANLQGEVIGSGGDVGTTYVLSGETRGIAFTLTLAEDATHVVESVSIPTRSFDLSVDCAIDIRSGSAICENFIVSGGVSSTLATTLPFSPFAVPVSTLGVVASTDTDTTVPESTEGGGTASATGTSASSLSLSLSSSAASLSTPITPIASSSESTLGGETTGLGVGSSSESAVSFSTSVGVGVTSTPSPSAPSSIASIPSSISTLPSELSSQSALIGASESSIPASSTATSPSPSPSPSAPAATATLASPSAAQSSTSGASGGHFTPSGVLMFAFVVIPWILV